MKLSEMTHEQKSRWIAEKLEPMPSKAATGGRFSRTEYWVGTEDGHWQPRDMINDPAMTVILLKELLRCRDHECIISQDEIEMSWRLAAGDTGHSFMVSLIKNTLEQGVADSFMKANGFEEEEYGVMISTRR